MSTPPGPPPADDRSTARGPSSSAQDASPLDLVVRLCAELRAAQVRYCHWKSNDVLHLSATAVNDLDLLVDRHHVQGFLEVLARCGFKQAQPRRHRQVPGVLHFYGLDSPSGRLVHVDAQAHLVLGDDTTKNVRLPLEDAYLASGVQGELFVVPAVEFELAVLVVRLALKHGTWDAALFGLAALRPGERRELEFLWARADGDRLREVVEEHLPEVGWPAWSLYCRALLDDHPLPRRLSAGRGVVSGLADRARRPLALDTAVRCGRRVEWVARKHLLRQRNVKRLVAGGALVAVVGGDGAGKTTAVQHLAAQLGGPLATRVVHLGKPARSLSSVGVKGAVVLARRVGWLDQAWLPNYPTAEEHRDQVPPRSWLLWQLVTARDRRRSYRRAWRAAGRGDVVICDRFPVDQVTLMDGPRTRWVPAQGLGRLDALLVGREQDAYRAAGRPDVLVVLRVDPDVAVERKRGVDEPDFVRHRSAEVHAADWSGTGAVVLDAGQDRDTVQAALTAEVWNRL